MVSLNRLLVVRNVVGLMGLTGVATRRNAGLAPVSDPTPDHPFAGYRWPVQAGRPQLLVLASLRGEAARMSEPRG